ncbi:hypothetical protein ACFQS7_11050 [Dankookia sp. GCM10030260]|uniref:hypothetical protein n=1 Tax=Dankookia sp. GCM10030260 TaxID=3273390 RepID=UPI0036190AA2
MLRDLLDGWIGLRARWRGYGLPIFASPLLPAALVAAVGGDEKIVLGSALGFGASLLGARVLRRGRRGDAKRASWIMAVGTGLAAHFAADLGTIFPFVMAGGALLGTRLMYTALPETAPPPPPAPPPPAPGPIEESRIRLARIESVAARLADPRLQGVAMAMEGVLDDLTARPDRLPMARRFLTVHLDGVERIVQRLEAGAAPPANLPSLLDELTRTAGELRGRLQHEETEALEIQVKVLSDRLREEGYR